MLFDLKGKRRRAVQGTYLALAILIGLGLVGFGVGSSVNGGLSDIFSGGGNGSNTASKTLQKDIDAANRQLQVNPHNQAALKTLVERHYQLAGQDENQTSGAFGKTGQQQLSQASAAWERYLAVNPSPDPALAALMVQAYIGLNAPAKGVKPAEIVAAAQPSVNAYLRVVQFATLAHDTRTADLASRKALDLAPPGQRATVKQAIAQAKAAGAGAGAQPGAPAGSP
jgi:hypothetical protein